MDLLIYLNKYIKVHLNNGYFYEGKVVNADKDSLEIIDRNGHNVCLMKSAILLITDENSIKRGKNEE